jgi:SsrA-binding protein
MSARYDGSVTKGESDKSKESQAKVVCRNRRASHDYHLEETVECGLVLRGTEVKVLRASQVSLEEAYAQVEQGELWLVNMTIPGYESASWTNHAPKRQRKLLVHRRELAKLEQRVELKNKTLVPLKIYFNERGLAKVTIAVASGKKQHDKRDSIREREQKRDIQRMMRRS